MPLHVMSATDAVATRKANPFASWGDRNGPNRIEPLARPGFDVPFRLQPGESIFTVGSCFARNVEVDLMRRGFRIPMRDLFKTPELMEHDPGLINNFATPSILNEFSWALGAREFVPQDHILEVAPGRYADLHLIPSTRPDSWEVALARRIAITRAYRAIIECRVLIITLGLVEVWFDQSTGYYLNAAPRPSVVRAEPDRFQLHVLSFEETLDHLERALLLVREHAPSIRVLLTVSPVPLAATHRPQDVMVANSYSKSVLRTVAETVCARYGWVSYYPSYESVSISDRKRAWCDDLVHVRDEIVALNVGRMVEAFTDSAEAAKPDDERIEDMSIAVERAVSARASSAADGERFFARHADYSALSVDFALEHAAFLAAASRHAEALAILDEAPKGEALERVAVARAAALSALGRGAEALAVIDPHATPKARSFAVWYAFLMASLATGDPDAVSGALVRWARAQPRRAGYAYGAAGRWFLDRGSVGVARSYLEHAVQLDLEATGARID